MEARGVAVGIRLPLPEIAFTSLFCYCVRPETTNGAPKILCSHYLMTELVVDFPGGFRNETTLYNVSNDRLPTN